MRDCPARIGRDGADVSGRGIGLVALCLFLTPIVLAIVGAVCFGGSARSQLAGGIAGLLLGMVLALAAAKAFWGGKRERTRSR